MKCNDAGIALIQEFEGLSLKPYVCPAGVYTIGYGHTGGVSAQSGSITKDDAVELLKQDLRKAENAVTMLVKEDINENQFSSLCCFVFNLGMGALRGSSLLRLINSGDLKDAADHFLPWNKIKTANGYVVSDGLVRRRKAERELFLS